VPELDLSRPDATAEMLDDLAALVNIESPSRDLVALRTSGAAVAELIRHRLGADAELVPTEAGPIVHWSGGGEPKVLIVGHHDTVFPIGSLAARPFTVAGGRVTGPGVFDMKGGIVQAIHAVAALGDRRGVELLFSPDEEVGSAASRDFIEERARACGAVLVLEPSADGGALKIARKGVGTFELFVHGKAAHAGLEPEKGVNALVEAAHQVLAINTFGDPSVGTTVTPTVARVGTTDNVVPALAHVLVDVRVQEVGEKERVEAAMAALVPHDPATRLEVTGGVNRPPMPAASSEALFPIAVAVGEALEWVAAVAGVAVGGGSDGNFTAACGVPTLDGLGAVGGGAHADHEFLEIAEMVPRAQLVAGIVRRLQEA
jgi:glutamate carboxypeptidase